MAPECVLPDEGMESVLDLVRATLVGFNEEGHAMRELSCPVHPAGYVRRYRTSGPDGPGVYPQCVPGDGSPTHILTWVEASAEHCHTDDVAAQDTRSTTSGSLSPSELAVLRAAATGQTVRESARTLGKHPETVKSQRRQVILKLGVRNMTHAVGVAVHANLIKHGGTFKSPGRHPEPPS
jgi:DNA-binding CsgD family transcriptional regulator